MEILKDQIKQASNLKQYFRALDSFALRYIPTFFVILIGSRTVQNVLLKRKQVSMVTLFMILIVSMAISLLWTKLSIQTEISVFQRQLTLPMKKKALIRRGVAIFFFFFVTSAARTGKAQGIFSMMVRRLLLSSFTLSMWILVVSFIAIALRKSYQGRRSFF